MPCLDDIKTIKLLGKLELANDLSYAAIALDLGGALGQLLGPDVLHKVKYEGASLNVLENGELQIFLNLKSIQPVKVTKKHKH
jgi:hypothetical protein